MKAAFNGVDEDNLKVIQSLLQGIENLSPEEQVKTIWSLVQNIEHLPPEQQKIRREIFTIEAYSYEKRMIDLELEKTKNLCDPNLIPEPKEAQEAQEQASTDKQKGNAA